MTAENTTSTLFLLPLEKNNAVIGWAIPPANTGRRPSPWRHNYEWFPVCTVDYLSDQKDKYHPVNKPLGCWGI
jgi:hypothetical protein